MCLRATNLLLVAPLGGWCSSCLARPAKRPLPRSKNTARRAKVSLVRPATRPSNLSSGYQMRALPPVRPVDPDPVVSTSIAAVCNAAGRQMMPDLPVLMKDVLDYESRCPPVVRFVFAKPALVTDPLPSAPTACRSVLKNSAVSHDRTTCPTHISRKRNGPPGSWRPCPRCFSLRTVSTPTGTPPSTCLNGFPAGRSTIELLLLFSEGRPE
jgi:hypothetical protein